MSTSKSTNMSIRTNPKELPFVTFCVQHGEERDERLVAGLDEQDSERVIVESNTFEGLDKRGKDGSSGD